ncbi:MAG TPA: ribosomal-processing cysteine protease Prp [Feifaniaceae bacterium]|nr:ribosomal-processing cysteine protease Prp [Feifaniaceae bacterium]
MVQVCMLYQNRVPVGFEASGHAGCGEEGNDIVCSAVSALTQTVALGLKERLQLPVGLSIEEGYLYCILGQECTDAQMEQASILLDTLLLGLKSMEAAYGEYLSITEREV